MKMRTRSAMALAGTAVAASLALTGCSALSNIGGSNDAERDEETGEVTEEANIDVFALSVGDCMPATNSTDGEISDVDVVPCTEPHVDEVFHEFDLPEGELPTGTDLENAIYAECDAAFETFVGLPYDQSTLGYWWITPTQDTWDQLDDRLVQCVIYQPDPEDPSTQLELTASLKGSAI